MQLSKMVAGLGLAARFILAPEGMALAASPALPAINTNNVLNITSFGAIGDGVTTNTTAIQNAINTATTGGATNGLSGGTVRIPPGIFLSGPLTMKNFVNLQLDPGATLRLLPLSQYPGGDVSPGNFLTGSSLHDLEISGSGGIDGQGAPWWPGYKTNNRPVVIALSTCTRVLIQGITISNAPAQNISTASAIAPAVSASRVACTSAGAASSFDNSRSNVCSHSRLKVSRPALFGGTRRKNSCARSLPSSSGSARPLLAHAPSRSNG